MVIATSSGTLAEVHPFKALSARLDVRPVFPHIIPPIFVLKLNL